MCINIYIINIYLSLSLVKKEGPVVVERAFVPFPAVRVFRAVNFFFFLSTTTTSAVTGRVLVVVGGFSSSL